MFQSNNELVNLERLLASLESVDLSKVNLDAIVERISRLQNSIISSRVSNADKFLERLERFTDIADKYFSRMDTKKNDIRSYVGVSGNYKLYYNYVCNHAFLGRWYYEPDSNGRIKLDWRFNLEGRIEFVDSILYPERKICHLMGDINRKKKQPLWDNGLFWYNERLPERLRLIAEDFFSKSFFKTYSSLLRFGHSTTRNLIENLENGNILDSNEIREGQKQLRELNNDKEALKILQKAALLYPYINGKSEDYFIVEYQNKK